MKIALCFYGVHPDETNKKDNINRNLVPHYLKKNVFDINPDINCFIHSWSQNKKQQILEQYNPTEYIIEKQKVFDIPNEFKNIGSYNGENIKHINTYNLSTIEIFYSLTYSIKQALHIMREYETKNNFKHDIVILSMMDVIWLVPLNLNNIDLTAIYNPIWGKNNEHSKQDNYNAVKGDWFISNSDYIYQFSELYNNLPKFLKETTSMHIIFKLIQNTITNNIKYIYNDVQNYPIEADRQRGLIKNNIL